jgi:alkylhydroperoxidase family enzyme
MSRIAVPEGMDPIYFACQEIGSAKLRAVWQQAMAVRWVNDSTLTPREQEAPRRYAAVISSCGRCSASRPARDYPGFSEEEIDEAFYTEILDYETSPVYSDRERLSVKFCERFWTDHRSLATDDGFWATMKANFTEEEIGDLVILAGLMQGWAQSIDVLLGLESACVLDGIENRRALPV